MKTYIDCGAGVAGDMILGALIGLGVSRRELEAVLKQAIPVRGWSLGTKSIERRMWPAWSVWVKRDRAYTSVLKMRAIVNKARIPMVVKRRSLRILGSLQRAEHQAHGHDHGRFDPRGLGRIDTLVDVIGTSWGFWRLGIQTLIASPLNTGRVAPATSVLLSKHKVPIYSDSPKHELATPTGVAILTEMSQQFRSLPHMRLFKSGYGAGTLERADKPNVLALYQGEFRS